MSRIILIRGTPGSGKSTLAKQINVMEGDFQSRYVHLEADQYFINSDGDYIFDHTQLHNAHNWCQSQTDFALNTGHSVIVSNTFTTIKELKPYFKIAKKYNITPVVILCQNQFKSIHNVPEETIEKMKNRFQYDLTELWNYLYGIY